MYSVCVCVCVCLSVCLSVCAHACARVLSSACRSCVCGTRLVRAEYKLNWQRWVCLVLSVRFYVFMGLSVLCVCVCLCVCVFWLHG